MISRLTTLQLQSLFAKDIEESFVVTGSLSEKPLFISPKNNSNIKFKVYIFNCTNPPGGRSWDECKIQLKIPNQPRGARGRFDESDCAKILIVGFFKFDDVDYSGAWIIWETNKHYEFAYSANLQIKLGYIYDTIEKKFFYVKKRGNNERVVLSDRSNLAEAIDLRQKIDLNLV